MWLRWVNRREFNETMIATPRLIFCFLLTTLWAVTTPCVPADSAVWCEYEEVGHMTDRTLVVVYTDGLFRVWEGPKHPKVARPTQWFYEETLTPEEKRFLDMWLVVTDSKSRPLNREPSDAGREVRLHEGGKTNTVWFSPRNEAELGQTDRFFYALTRRAYGDKNPSIHKVMQRLVIPKERPLALLKVYITRASERPDLVSEALRFLSHQVTADEWASFVKERLQQADGKKRALLLQALTASDYGLQTRIPEEHLRALRTLLDHYKTLPEAK